jgi:uncharacterized membrane protein YkoI
MTRTLLIAAGTGLLAFAGISAWPVLASDQTRADERTASRSVPAAEWMPASEVARNLEGMGYTVREIEREDGRYEVEVTNPDGLRMEAYVDPRSGEILDEEGDDR